MRVLTAQQMRDLEKSAVDNGTTYRELMELAGSGASMELIKNGAKGKKVTIICGKGNNGGDGYVMARILSKEMCTINIIRLGEPRTEDAKVNADFVAKLGIPIFDFPKNREEVFALIATSDYIVDAVYGIGFRGALDENTAEIAKAVNTSNAFVMAVDIPSGAGCDNGSVAGGCFEADMTVTFTTLKPAHVLYPSMDYCGKVVVADVGIYEELIRTSNYVMMSCDEFLGTPLLSKRRKSSNKGSYGKLLAVAGSYGMAGAAIMCGKAAQRSGAGLVNMALPRSIYPIVAGRLTEAVFTPLDETEDGSISADCCERLVSLVRQSSAVLIGCGLGHNDDTEKLTVELLKSTNCPIILDADGINSIVPHIDLLRTSNAPLIMTPHPGEMARLLGCSVAEVQQNRAEIAVDFAREYGVILVLKGANTLVSDGENLLVNLSGNAGMARGGSGDVLAGIIAALVARGMEPLRAAACGVYVHGTAGDRAAEKFSQETMLPTDMIDEIRF